MNSINLRALEPDDYILISHWHNDNEITKNHCGNHFFVSAAETSFGLSSIPRTKARAYILQYVL